MPYHNHKSKDADIAQALIGCRQNHRGSQQQLFAMFYNYAMSIARRYTGQVETAEEVVNDAFFKVFTKIHLYSGELPFRLWLRRIVINTAIDRLRSTLNAPPTHELQPWHDLETHPDVIEDLTREQILALTDQLSPAYRTVFNLFVVDGLAHEEIAEMLGITVGASKSNLARARQNLKNVLSEEFQLSKKT